jgi:hypothetical protein
LGKRGFGVLPTTLTLEAFLLATTVVTTNAPLDLHFSREVFDEDDP